MNLPWFTALLVYTFSWYGIYVSAAKSTPFIYGRMHQANMVSRSIAQTRALVHHPAPLLEWVSLQEASGSPRHLYKALQTILCDGNDARYWDRPTMVMSTPNARNHQVEGSQFRTQTVLFTAKNIWCLVILLVDENGMSVTQTGLDTAHTMDPTHINIIPHE